MGILVPIIGPIKHLRARGPKAVPGPYFYFHLVHCCSGCAGIAISRQLEATLFFCFDAKRFEEERINLDFGRSENFLSKKIFVFFKQ